MYFEGNCLLRSLPVKIKEAVLSSDLSSPTPAPLWEMVSSNVGTQNTDDGYVFQSVANRNGHKVVFGIKSEVNGFDDPNYPLEYGYRVFLADKYTPGAAGVNGQFDNYIKERLPVVGNSISGYGVDTLPLRYWISVKRDRVIVAVKTDMNHAQTRFNIAYFGRPQIYFDPTDVGVILGVGAANEYNYGSFVRMIAGPVGVRAMSIKGSVVTQNKVWGGQVYPSRLFLQGASNLPGYRGVLDLYVLFQDGRLRQIDNIRIGSTDYLAIEVPGSAAIYGVSNQYNNLSPSTSTHLFLFPKD